MPLLIIVNGAPGVGKSILTRRLSAQLQVPAIGKDDIKEFLFDTLGYSNRDWSRVLGRASSEMLYLLARECLRENQTIIIENAFWPEFAAEPLQSILAEQQADMIEIYCYTDDETRMQRFRDRHESGERHPGHVDNLATLRDAKQFGPLEFGKIIRVDTTQLNDQQYDKMFSQLLQLVEP